jgi:hypothetical protein
MEIMEREKSESHKTVEDRTLRPMKISDELCVNILLLPVDSLHLKSKLENMRPKACAVITRQIM